MCLYICMNVRVCVNDWWWPYNGHVVMQMHYCFESSKYRRCVLHVFHDHDDLERRRVSRIFADLYIHIKCDHLQSVHVLGLEVQRPGYRYRTGSRVLVHTQPTPGQLRRSLRHTHIALLRIYVCDKSLFFYLLVYLFA